MKVALLVSDFNAEVTSRMLERAEEHARALGVEVSHTVHVPGVFDMPLMIKHLLGRRDVEGLVIIGAVIKGDTQHDEVIAHAVARAATDLALQFSKPVALGVTGPGMTEGQALDRIDNAANAVASVVRMVKALKET